MRQMNTSPPYAKHAWPSTTPQIHSTPQIHKKVAIIIFGAMLVCGLLRAVQAWREQSVFNHMSATEHLREAKANSLIPALVFRHLAAIPQDASEYKEVPALMQAARGVEKEDQLRLEAEKKRFTAQDAQEQREMAQKERDSDASLSSYWPTTVRVDTDMDSFWLKGEERTCVTTPGANGRVAIVTCNYSSSHQTHNIPVKFWGSVDRNFVSDWRCRREGDDFVCRATD